MPVTHLQNMGGSSECFLFDIPESRAPLRLKPGVMHNLRRFQGFIQQLARAGWISHVRGNRQNLTIIGESSDLETFMFLPSRSRLSKVAEILREFDRPFCFYCRKRLRDQGEVDHFIPWSLYPRDTGHNFVLAHKGCNGRKRDTLAAYNHLERWIDRNAETDAGFQGGLEEIGFITNWQGTLMIARWAYKQGAELRSRAWISDLLYESVDDTHIRLLG